MAAPIDFYFDFSTPYGYLAAERIDALAAKHGRSVTWRPMQLGDAFKLTGGQPLPSIPMKGEYATRDFLRSARQAVHAPHRHLRAHLGEPARCRSSRASSTRGRTNSAPTPPACALWWTT